MSRKARLVGRIPQAIEFGMRATREDGGRAEYWDTLGLAYVAASRWHDAGVAFDRASSLAPYDVRYLADSVQVQVILLRDGEIVARTRALQLAERAVRIDPNNPRAHVTRALVMQVIGNLSEASRSIEHALELDPRSPDSQQYVIAAQVDLGLGRNADAERVARQGVATLGMTRSSIAVRLELARALFAVAKARDSLAELDTLLSIDPQNIEAQRLRAEIRAALPN
jgi:tetratricopeptide (TPR) repeat protein